jgi:hypothetical protein
MSPTPKRVSRSCCSKCRSPEFFVYSSKVNAKNHRLRRWHCPDCGHRLTTYEITEAELKRYMRAESVMQAMSKILDTQPGQRDSGAAGASCMRCHLWTRAGTCDLGIPEAGDTFAQECPHYQDHATASHR